MKKLLMFALAVAALTALAPGTAGAQDFGNLFTHRLYLGIGSMPFEVSGLPNMEITDDVDDQGNNLGFAAGYISLNLNDKEAHGYHAGVLIGYEFLISNTFGVVAELGMYNLRQDDNSNAEANNNSSLTSGYLGFEYRFISTEFFYLGILPKLGFVRAKLDFGESVTAVSGTGPVFIYKNGVQQTSLTTGQAIAVTITGFSAQALLTAGLRLGPVEIFAQGGATYAAFGGFDVEVGGIKIPSTSRQLVVPGNPGTPTYADPDPKISSVGAFFQVGAALNL